MKNSINLYWFSGTGNSLVLAKEIESYMKINKKQAVKLIPIEKNKMETVKLTPIIGIIVPVAMQGTYSLVWDFINKLPKTDSNIKCFFIDTLGQYSGGILGPVKSILMKKGYIPLCAKEIKMPSNFNRVKKANSQELEIIEKAKVELHNFCDEILQEKIDWKDIPIYSDIMSSFSRIKFMHSLYRKLLPINIDSNRCSKCQICMKICPVGNWSSKDKRGIPRSNKTCILCQRCIAFCPTNAIKLGEKNIIQYRSIELKELLDQLSENHYK